MIVANSLGQLVVADEGALPDFQAMTFKEQEVLVKKWVAAGAIPASEEDWYFGMISVSPEEWSSVDRAKFEAAVRAYKSGKRFPVLAIAAAITVAGVGVMLWMAITGK